MERFPADGSRDHDPVADPVADPVDWDLRYRIGDTPWNRGAAPPLEEFLSLHPVRGDVLVPGCGTGHDVRLLAGQGARVTGIDLAETALAMARNHPPVGDEHYALGNLFALPEEWTGRFDWVVEHTCFCAIPPLRRGDYVDAVVRALKPGGFLLAVFFLDTGVEQGPPHGATREEIASLFDPFFHLEREWKPVKVFPEREGGEMCQLRRKN